MSQNYVSVDPQIEIFEYGKDFEKKIVLTLAASHRLKNPNLLKNRYLINNASKEVLLLMDGTRTLEEVKLSLLKKYTDESLNSLELIFDAFFAMVNQQNDFKIIFLNEKKLQPITYYVFDNNYPTTISLELTDQCNLKCRHCYGLFEPSNNKKILEKNKIPFLLGSFKQVGVTTIEMTGGDPSVYPYSAFFIDTAFEYGITNITYLSNGVTLPKDIYDAMMRHRENVLVQVDLHSTRDDYYEWFTGSSGVVDQIKENIANLIHSGISVFVTMTVTPKNLRDVLDVAEWSYELGALQFSVSPVIKLGRACKDSEGLLLDTEENIIEFNNILQKVEELFPGFLKKAKTLKELNRKNCGALMPHATIDSSGKIKICPMDALSQMDKSLGNAFEIPIKQIYDDNVDFLRDFTNLEPPDILQETCSTCKNSIFCHTCVARGLVTAHQMTGRCKWYDNAVSYLIKERLDLRR